MNGIGKTASQVNAEQQKEFVKKMVKEMAVSESLHEMMANWMLTSHECKQLGVPDSHLQATVARIFENSLGMEK